MWGGRRGKGDSTEWVGCSWRSALGMVSIELIGGEGLNYDEQPVAGTASLNGNVKSGDSLCLDSESLWSDVPSDCA